MQRIAHERVSDYEAAISHIESTGYAIKGIVVDGIQTLFKTFAKYELQMCKFHMVAIVRRKLTKNPKLEAGMELWALVCEMKHLGSSEFESRFEAWKKRWDSFLKERTLNPFTGRSIYTHKRLRSAMLSIEHYRPWLFTFEKVEGMPRTNNQLEGAFTDLRKKLSVHSGMSETNRTRFVNGLFLAYEETHNKKGGRD